MAKNSETQVVTPKFRMAFPSLLQPRKNLRGDMQYEVLMLFPVETDLTALKAAAKAALVAKWGPDETKWPTTLRKPFRKGDEDSFAKYEGFKNMIVVRASTKTPPGVVDHKVQPVLDAKECYSGRWAIAAINAFAYDTQGNKGVSFGLNHVQLLDHDTPFAGRTRAEDVFQPTTVQQEKTVSGHDPLFD